MFDIKFLRENTELAQKAFQSRSAAIDTDQVLEMDATRRKLVYEVQQLKSEQNTASAEIAKKKKAKEDASNAIAAMKQVSANAKAIDEKVKAIEQELNNALLLMPNIPHDSVPVGSEEEANILERKWSEPTTFDFTPKDHIEIGEKLGIIDFERAAKLSGARFVVLKGAGSMLERSLINFMMDTHTRENGYTEILPPFLVQGVSMQGSGQLPKFAEEAFTVEGCDMWLIPTAEVPLTNLHRDEVISDNDLSIDYCAYTPCFRSEAGSYGKDTKGMLRQHQFDKVELYKFVRPEESWEALETLTGHAEGILQKLGLPYQVMNLCTGDIGFSAAKTYDLEVWLPGQDKYREISSCSNCTDFQARRANIRFKRNTGKPEFVHTLNGSGLAVGRTLIAILENYQQEDGSVVVPQVLRSYMGGMERIEKA